jgi:acyl-CoA reductase-like NAD-dependent aldehyde dehydrogenase
LSVRFDVLAAKLQSARSAIAKAEEELESAISEIQAAPRWEKVRISEVLESAFEELRRARTELARIESMIGEDAG